MSETKTERAITIEKKVYAELLRAVGVALHLPPAPSPVLQFLAKDVAEILARETHYREVVEALADCCMVMEHGISFPQLHNRIDDQVVLLKVRKVLGELGVI